MPLNRNNMKYLPLLCFLLGPLAFAAPNKEILELSRDVANLQDQVRTIQRTLDENLSQLKLQTQQTLEAINKNNTAIAVMQGGITDRLNAQGSTLAAPVAGVNAKLDQMSGDFQALRSSVDDLTTRMNKLQDEPDESDAESAGGSGAGGRGSRFRFHRPVHPSGRHAGAPVV